MFRAGHPTRGYFRSWRMASLAYAVRAIGDWTGTFTILWMKSYKSAVNSVRETTKFYSEWFPLGEVQTDMRNFMEYLFLRPFGFYLDITAKYDMPFTFEQGRGTRRWTTSALGLERNRGPRYIAFHGCIFARDSAQIHHRRCRNTA